MKTVLRIALILVVALAITGVTLLVVKAAGDGTSQPAGFREGTGRGLRGGGQFAGLDQHPEGQEPGRGLQAGRGENHPGAFSWAETIKNLLIVAVVVLVVVLIERLIKSRRRRQAAAGGQS